MAKGNKFVNPADKARKEARKKELKKNKKQRQQVRTAAIEKRDPDQIMADLEKLDSIEFDPETHSTANEGFLKDKRKRLMENWSKLLDHYVKEDPEKHAKLKKMEADYQIRHKRIARDFEGVMAARNLRLEDVFLPPKPTLNTVEIANDNSPLSKSVYRTPMNDGINPPGYPPGSSDYKQLAYGLNIPPVMSTDPLPHRSTHSRLPESIAPNQRIKPKKPYNPVHAEKSETERSRTDNLNKTSLARPGPANPNGPPKTSVSSNVIESKPIIFKPKVTKFIPASVRSKLTVPNERRGEI